MPARPLPFTLKNPVLTASGTFGYGDETSDLMPPGRVGGIITKTITREPRDGNPPPRLAETASGMLNSIGLQNIGLERFIAEKLPGLVRMKTALIISVAGQTADDYEYLAGALAHMKGIAAIELNLSCPNLRKRMICLDEDLSRDIVRRTVRASTVPVIVKLSPQVQDLPALAAELEKAGAAALTLVNTFPGMAIDVATRRARLAVVTGGLSGPCIKPLALRCVWEVYGRVSIPIIGCGGIETAEDAVEFMLAGASAVSVGTAVLRAPACPAEIAAGISRYARSHGFRSVWQLTRAIETAS